MESRAALPTASLRLTRLAFALVVMTCAVVLVGSLPARDMASAGSIPLHTLTFYGVTAGAYILLPFVRRGDIAMMAMWLVLGAGVAPCFAGHELSPAYMFADMVGVLMSAAPVYIARFRHIAQDDTRFYRRRDIDLGL